MSKTKNAENVLPSKEWLMKNGYSGLVKCMEEDPEKFAQIKQNKPVKMRKEKR